MYWASAALRGDRIYLLGGLTEKDNKFTKSVYTCSASALFQSCVQNSVQSSLEAELERATLVKKASTWRQVASLSVTQSTCESFHGQLLAIGGYDSATAVYMYNSTANSWEVISHMTTARYHCFTAVLPDNQLMVVGGYSY